MLNKQFRLILNRFFLLICLYTSLRFVYYFYHINQFSEFSKFFVTSAFLHGVRFDIAAISKLNIFFFLIWLLPLRVLGNAMLQSLLKWLFIIVNTTFISANLVDIDLIQFTGQRMTIDFWSLGGDWFRQTPQLLVYYWKLTSIGFLFLFSLILFYPNWKKHFQFLQTSHSKAFFVIFSFLIIMALSIRGGLQHKPLSIAHANIFTFKSLNDLVLNSTFTLLQPSNGQIGPVKFVADPVKSLAAKGGVVGEQFPALAKKMKQNLKTLKVPPDFLSSKAAFDNVVIFIMESFALEYTGLNGVNNGYTPFLNELAKNAYNFENHFANGRRSIEAMPSIFCSIPSLQKEPFLTSPYQSVNIKCLPELLNKQGFESAFFHGADNGTMYFDSFSKRIGFDHYWGLNEFPEPEKHHDGSWGIYDEPFLNFTLEKINQMRAPFLVTFFSLSSHQPYSVPEKYKGKFPKGTLEIHESVGYADFALRQFFEKAKKQSWYENTLFIITADHTQKTDLKGYDNILGHYRVPLIVFHPKKEVEDLPLSKVTQHTDIQPSVLHWLNINEELAPFGQSIFVNSTGKMLNFDGQRYYLYDGDELISFDGKENLLIWDISHSPWTTKSIGDDANTNYLKSYVQFYLNGLIKNKWYGRNR